MVFQSRGSVHTALLWVLRWLEMSLFLSPAVRTRREEKERLGSEQEMRGGEEGSYQNAFNRPRGCGETIL